MVMRAVAIIAALTLVPGAFASAQPLKVAVYDGGLGGKAVAQALAGNAEIEATVVPELTAEALLAHDVLYVGSTRLDQPQALQAIRVFVGVGGGLVLGGRLYRGSSGVAAEIGHVKVRADGRPCGCGQRGCLEAYLGGANLSAWLEEMVAEGWPALEKQAHREGTMHPGLVERLAARGDGRARELWRQLADMFGTVLANAVTLLNPAALVLGGTVLDNCPGLHRLTVQVLRERALAVSSGALEVFAARLGPQAGSIGAAWFARGLLADQSGDN